jgi:hypothetical protein
MPLAEGTKAYPSSTGPTPFWSTFKARVQVISGETTLPMAPSLNPLNESLSLVARIESPGVEVLPSGNHTQFQRLDSLS